MKKILIAFALLISSATHARPPGFLDPHDPVTPWPLEQDRQVMSGYSLSGTWASVSSDNQKKWILQITPLGPDSIYQWNIYEYSQKSAQLSGEIKIHRDYAFGITQMPFMQPEYLIMILRSGKLHIQIGSEHHPRLNLKFKKVCSCRSL